MRRKQQLMEKCQYLAIASVLVALTACASSLPLEQLDSLSRTMKARTIVYEPDFSIYSPFDTINTHPYVDVLRDQDRSLRAFFNAKPKLPWIVVLIPSEELGVRATADGNTLRISDVRLRRRSGVQGIAGERVALVYVAAPQEMRLDDGRVITRYMGAVTYAQVLRHELVHLYAFLVGLKGDPWFNEALAGLLEDAPVKDGCLSIDDVGSTLARLASVPSEQRDLRRALTVDENIEQLEAGQPYPFPPARDLGRSFLQFLLLQSGSNDPLAELRRIRALSVAQLLAHESEWRSWLDRQQ